MARGIQLNFWFPLSRLYDDQSVRFAFMPGPSFDIMKGYRDHASVFIGVDLALGLRFGRKFGVMIFLAYSAGVARNADNRDMFGVPVGFHTGIFAKLGPVLAGVTFRGGFDLDFDLEHFTVSGPVIGWTF